MRLDRRSFLVGSAGVFLAGCTEGSIPEGDLEASSPEEAQTQSPVAENGTPSSTRRPTTAPSTTEQSGSRTADRTDTETDTRTETRTGTSLDAVPTAEEPLYLAMSPNTLRGAARSGGPPKDGIPSIDEPSFVSAEAADHVDDSEIVIGLERNGEARAYPRMILVQHEIVNDRIGSEPVAVTYCPLTGTAQGFERGETTFGVSGRLINNNLVMYDRTTETWWPQIPATSVPGPWNANPKIKSLSEFRVIWTTWESWRAYRPDTSVLSEKTGHLRSYNNDPYGNYYEQDSTLFPRLNDDDSYHLKESFMGVRTTEGAAAFLKSSLRDNGTMAGEIAGEPIVAVHDPRLDTAYVYRNPEEVSVSVTDAEAVVDGDAHEPDSLPLERLLTFDAMWFAWIGFYPDSNVYA